MREPAVNLYGLTLADWIGQATDPPGCDSPYPVPRGAARRWRAGEDPTEHAAAASEARRGRMVVSLRELPRTRRAVLARLKAVLAQIMTPSQWVTGEPSRPLLAHVFVKDGQIAYRKLPGSAAIDSFGGFTEDGIVTDMCLAIVVTYWRGIGTADLRRLLKIALPLAAKKAVS